MFDEQLGGFLGIEEQVTDFFDVLEGYTAVAAGLCENVGGREELDGVSERGVDARLCDFENGVVIDRQAFGLGADADNALNFIEGVRQGANGQQTVEQIDGDTVGRDDIFCAADGAHAAVGGKDDDRGQRGFEGAVEVGEAFNVEHVDFVNEEHARHKLGDALVNVLVDDLVDLSP